MEGLQRLNDSIYRRCPVCHEDLTVIARTSNRWVHRLVGACRITVSRCHEHDYTRIDTLSGDWSSMSEIWGGDNARFDSQGARIR